MTLYHMLPFVGGWSIQWMPMGEGTPQTYPQGFAVLVPNQELVVFEAKYELGWLLNLLIGGNDCYLACRIQTDGFDSSWISFNMQMSDPYNAEPRGLSWSPTNVTYCRPNQLNSAGIFEMMYLNSYYAVPYHGYLRISLKLLPSTTQPFAVGWIYGQRLVVTDYKMFLKDYRKIQYGRWAPLMDMLSYAPLLRSLTHRLDLEKITHEEQEEVLPKELTR